MIQMVERLNVRCCTYCRGKSFSIIETDRYLYNTNSDGTIQDRRFNYTTYKGICRRCKRVYDMIPLYDNTFAIKLPGNMYAINKELNATKIEEYNTISTSNPMQP